MQYVNNLRSINNIATFNSKCVAMCLITEQMMIEHELIGLKYNSDLEIRFLSCLVFCILN